MSTKTRHDWLLWLVQVAILGTIMAVMNYTPLGMLRLGVVEITFMMIPVIIGAIVCGPTAGALLGFEFGFFSFWTCINASSVFGATLLSINPWFTALVCFIPRIFMGWACGMIFRALYQNDAPKFWSFSLSGLSGALLNTIGFTGLLVAFFWTSDYIQGLAAGKGIFAFLIAFVGINGLVEAIVCTALAASISRALLPFIKLKSKE